MSLTGEIWAAWRRGWGASLRRQINTGAGEERALAYIMLAAVLMFISQVPAILHLVAADPNDSLELGPVLGMRFAGALFFAPLLAYGLAAVAHLGARLAGGSGTFLHARLALFWALVCVAPVSILAAAATPYVGQAGAKPLQFGVLLVFAAIWGDTMRAAESFNSSLRTGLALAFIAVTVAILIGFAPIGI